MQRALFLLLAAVCLSSCRSSDEAASNLCSATEYGVSTALPDNTAVFQTALNSCAGRTMHVPAGTYVFAPALAYADTNGFGTGIVIPERTSIVGDGRGKTILKITGPGNYAYFLWIHDAGDVSIRQLTLAGNNARNPAPPVGAPACYYDYGRAIFIQSTTRAIGNIAVEGNEFISFSGTSWITVLGGGNGNTVGIDGGPVTIDDNDFKSVAGNAVAPETIICPSSAISIQGLGATASAANVIVSRNVVDADFIKSGVAVWSGAAHVRISENTIRHAGMGLPVPHDYSNGSYAILVYQQHAVFPDTTVFVKPTAVEIVGNVIEDAYSSGIYVLEGRSILIENNLISGQLDTYDVTEPRGAIALNLVDNEYGNVETAVSNNTLSDSAIGLSIVGGALPIVDSNVIDSIPTRGVGIKVNGQAVDGVTLTLTNTSIIAAQTADDVSSFVGFFPSRYLAIDGLYQTGATYPLRWYADVAATPSHPQGAYCKFSDFGSIKRVYVAMRGCATPPGCFTPQPGYWPNYGANCTFGG
jgi:hypothetical protein